MSGGFGDETCHMCHNDNMLNDPAGTFRVVGLPESYRAGETYRVTIRLKRNGLLAAGFQISARGSDGKQAGTWKTLDDATQQAASREIDGLEFVQQTLGGSTFDGEAVWEMDWTAPASGDIRFYAAANASNDDASPLGDYIYTSEMEATAK